MVDLYELIPHRAFLIKARRFQERTNLSARFGPERDAFCDSLVGIALAIPFSHHGSDLRRHTALLPYYYTYIMPSCLDFMD